MAATRDLRRRIRSVKNTSQITKAMQMVSATKMRKAQSSALSGRPYNQVLSSALSLIFSDNHTFIHPLLSSNTATGVGVLLLTSDKGLCGALNTNLFRLIQSSEVLRGKEIVFYTVGKKGRDFIVRTNRNLEADFENSEVLTYAQTWKINKYILNTFLENKVGEVYMLYPHFISTLRQEPRLLRLLPMDFSALREMFINAQNIDTEEAKSWNDFLFEPDKDALLDFVLTHFVESQIYQALFELKASEHSARMMAMQNATTNALDLVADLTLTYNQMRQEGITRELLEISTAAAAME